jgi:hypothetical protein
MKIHNPVRRILFTVLTASALACASVQAQYLNTFDNAGSFTTGARNFNPPPIWIGHDYGNDTANSVVWSSQDAAGNAGSGSASLNWTWNYTADGSAAFTMDLFPSPGQNFATLSFDLMVDPSSTPGGFNDYGYFQIIARNTDGYNFNDLGFGRSLVGSGGAVPAVGVWQHIVIPLGSFGSQVRALTIQDYNDSGRHITGNETIYIDNLAFAPVPEPSTATLLGLGLCGAILRITRRQKK